MDSNDYHFGVVAASVAIAILASYAALGLVSRVASTTNSSWQYWLAGGSIAMGLGIWAMHFVGMLAMELPIALSYNTPLTAASTLPAIFASALLLLLIRHYRSPRPAVVALGSVVLGAGIGGMHYAGMAAIELSPAITFDPGMVALSVLVAIAFSTVGVWAAFHQAGERASRLSHWFGAVAMGCAVAAMHYTGMEAAQFAEGCFSVPSRWALQTGGMAPAVAMVAVLIVGTTILVTVMDARLGERNSQLVRDLRAAKQQAEEAGRAKGEFLANMSHEIRTPMNAIIGMTGLALKTELTPRQHNYIDKAHRSAKGLLGILNDILDFSKIEAGKLTVERIPLRLEEVLSSLADQIGFKVEDKGLELVFDLPADLPNVLLGDPLRLEQVLLNLANNAVKFTERGEVTIGIRRLDHAPDRATLEFRVQDSGIGIAPEHLSRLFGSFSQADSSTSRRYGGTGLGLAICKRLVELMDGRIDVQSTPGKGSCFRFVLAMDIATGSAQTGAIRAHHAPRAAPQDLGLRALVVDDNAVARELIAGLASGFGLVPDLAEDGETAVAMAREAELAGRGYEMLLIDWQMPGIGGVEVLRQLQAQGIAHERNSIMVSAHARDDVLEAARTAGVSLQAVLLKPITPSALLDAIGQVLGRAPHTAIQPTAAQDARDRPDVTPSALSGARVLLVEDNELNQELAMELLGSAGMEVVLANHGAQALERLAADDDFDVVLMDCQMPVMDGFEATRAIRLEQRWARLPVLAMTASALVGDRERVLAAGMNDHIPKPIDVAGMFTVLQRWVDPSAGEKRRSRKRAPVSSTEPIPGSQVKWHDIYGIDAKDGLQRTRGNETLYLKLLRQFANGNKDFASAFDKALACDDLALATRFAHTLRGTSGTIGAHRLGQLAARLEVVCGQRQSAEAIKTALSGVLQELAPLLHSLKVAIPATLSGAAPSSTAPSGAPPQGGSRQAYVPSPAQRRLAVQLRELLQNSDPEAVRLASELYSAMPEGFHRQALQSVVQAVEEYRFDDALDALGRWETTHLEHQQI